MRMLIRATLLIGLALAAVVVPFLLFGASIEEIAIAWFQQDLPASARFAWIVAILATDIFLPVPSSIVSTYGGGVLGVVPATLASWLGMTIGALLGYGLARLAGAGLVTRFARERNRLQTAALVERYGPLALVLVRGVPILAEASVLLLGAMRLSWPRFVVPVAASNLVISACYAAFGAYAADHNALPWAIVLAGVLPMIVLLVLRRWLPAR